MKVTTLCLLAGALVFGLVGGAVAEEAPAAPTVAKNVGDPVPDWEVKTVDTQQVVNGKKIQGDYALVFVNSSCSACRKEMKSLAAAEFKDLEVYIASVDFNPAKTIAKYRETMKITFPILDASDFKLLTMFEFGYTPATVIVSDNKLAFRHAGYSASGEKEIKAAFKKYMK